MRNTFSTITLATLLASVLTSCASAVGWRDHHTSSVLENQREILGRIKIREKNIDLNDCTVCLSVQTRLEDTCVKIDASGLFYKEATRPYAWLKSLECRREGGAKVRRTFEFPYFAAPTQNLDTIHYLGEIQIELEPGDQASVLVSNMLEDTLKDLHNRGKDPLPLKIHTALLKKQDTTWGDEQNTPVK